MSHCSIDSLHAAAEFAANRWTAHMLRGDFASAWRESDWIRQCGFPDPHRFWDGEPLDGRRVVLRCLHGLGDAVQFLRYVPDLANITQSLIVEVPPRMEELAPLLAGVSRVTAWNDPPPRECWDSQIEVMELPYFFRTELCDLPIAQNYLYVPHQLKMKISNKMGPARLPRVGLAWAAGEWNPARSIPFSLLRTLLLGTDCEFWNLQGGSAADDWSMLPVHDRLCDARALGDGLVTLAACIQQMDLIITVDTLAAHLAGALRKPVWLLLTTPADWRWMTGRNDSPWYPSLRIYRQLSPGKWDGVIEQLHHSLKKWLRQMSTAQVVIQC